MKELTLSLFPGIGLLDRGFEEEGFTVVRGPDPLWGGDVRRFHPPPGVFGGVIGGPPCTPFSSLAAVAAARGRPTKVPNLIPEFERCIAEAQPDWFLMENVSRAPIPSIEGYRVHALLFNNRWLGEEQNRVRRFAFGTRDGRRLVVDVAPLEHPCFEYAVVARHSGGGAGLKFSGNGSPHKRAKVIAVRQASGRSYARKCELQGLPPNFLEESPFTVEGKTRVVGNGVPLPMGRAIARGVRRALWPDQTEEEV